jgi:hypothetical protein
MRPPARPRVSTYFPAVTPRFASSTLMVLLACLVIMSIAGPAWAQDAVRLQYATGEGRM